MSKPWSEKTAEWMDALGNFGPTVNNEHVKGYTCDEYGEGVTTYWDAEQLREIAAACLEVAESLEGGGK